MGRGEEREREPEKEPATQDRKTAPLANLARCATPGQSEAAHTISSIESQGSPIMAPKCPLDSVGGGGGGGGSRKRARVMMRSSERIGLALGFFFFPVPHHPRGQVPEPGGGHWQTANTMPPQSRVSGRGKEAQGFFGVVQKCIFQSRGLDFSDLDE